MNIYSGSASYQATISAYQSTINTATSTVSNASEMKSSITDTIEKQSSSKATSDTVELSDAAKLQALVDETLVSAQNAEISNFSNLLSGMIGAQDDAISTASSGTSIMNLYNNIGDLVYDTSTSGAYGVDAVASDIIDMALSIADGDSSKLENLRATIIRAFEAAGMEVADDGTFSAGTLSDTSVATFNEVMDRLDYAVANNNSMSGYSSSSSSTSTSTDTSTDTTTDDVTDTDVTDDVVTDSADSE